MKLTFLGAARTVTGSHVLLEACGQRVLIDAGMYQGPDHLRHQGRPDAHVDYTKVDLLLLTHAHIDHSGNLPLVARLGFKGPIYATSATTDLCEVMLPDSAHIQQEDAAHDLRKWIRKGRVGPPPAPLYDMDDVADALQLFRSVRYDEIVELAPGLRARWRDAGHILGAASIEVWVDERAVTPSAAKGPGPSSSSAPPDDRPVKLLFSGDIGQPGRPILRDPSLYDDADYVIMESTYGNRRHEPVKHREKLLTALLRDAARNRGHIIIPSFAVGRTQELLYALNQLIENDLAPRLPTFVDSPLAISATEISRRHPECFDEDTRALLARGDDPMDFPGLTLTRTTEESKQINFHQGPMVVIASSGMCTGGRIRHHLQNHLDHEQDTILFVGYQAAGTLGRYLIEGNEQVKLFGEKVRVRARVRSLSAFSAHADVDGLLGWLQQIRGPRAVFVVHGEEEAALDFAALAHQRDGAPTLVPEFGQTFDLSSPGTLPTELDAMADIWRREVTITRAAASTEPGDTS